MSLSQTKGLDRINRIVQDGSFPKTCESCKSCRINCATVEYEEITRKIIGAAYAVYKQLGFGFLESVYKKAMFIELAKSGLKAEEEKPLQVHYDGQIVGDFFVDLFVNDRVVVELKSVRHLSKEHEVQLVNYLKGLHRDIGLLINFGPAGVDVKRKFREQKVRQD